ncbi:MAG: hypothetical protein KDC61_19590, partial [Saprospiraceae bacterium]|nr:hypothetical protein [Saprospiraceae bacterium]
DAANFPYWFKIINLLGCEPNQSRPLPVLVLLNERANQAFKMPYDPEAAKTDFPQINVLERRVNFAQKDDRLEGLPRAIRTILCRELSHLPLKIPAFWNAVRRELYDLRSGKNYIDFNEFKAICVKHGIAETDETQMNDLSQLLHDLGVILHFQELTLRDFIVLNPEWAVNAVYEVLRHKEVEEHQGRFDKEMLQRVWTDCQFTPFEQSHLLNLMLKDGLEVCFKAKENNREIYIAPQLLPERRPPELPWPPQGALLRYTFQYPFMPKGIIGRLIVRLHEHLETRDGKKLVWEKGMVIDNQDDCRALVEETEDVKTGLKLIKIEVSGPTPEERRYALRDITQALNNIHKESFANLKFEQKLPCCCSICIKSDDPNFFDLSILKTRKKPSIECTKSEDDVLVQDLFDGVFADEHKIKKSTQQSDTIRKLVAEDMLSEALDALLKHVPANVENDVIILQGQLNKLERGERLNIGESPDKGRARIANSILEILTQASI